MKIQLWHSRDSNFVEELYVPLRENFPDIEWIFPHGENGKIIQSEESLKGVDVFLAEVSTPATGLGIELGFAYLYKKRIICMYRVENKISSSLRFVTDEIFEYNSQEEMIEKLKNFFI